MLKKSVQRHAVTQPLDQSYRLIPLTQGQNAIVSAEDFEWISQWNWYAQWSPNTRSFYAARNIGSGGPRRMNNAILECTKKEFGDHENHNTLDNRRTNLRKVTRSQNQYNRKVRVDCSSGYKGVRYLREIGKWQSRIVCDGKEIHIGVFMSAKEAATAYDKEAAKLFGEFAYLNNAR